MCSRCCRSFDGSILDLVIDYLTYVFIPALFIYRYIPLPDYTLLLTTSLILVSSLFCFCNTEDEKQGQLLPGLPRRVECGGVVPVHLRHRRGSPFSP
jgi:phosphatidylserine synthase